MRKEREWEEGKEVDKGLLVLEGLDEKAREIAGIAAIDGFKFSPFGFSKLRVFGVGVETDSINQIEPVRR